MQSSSSNEYEIAYKKATNPETREEYWNQYANLVHWDQFPKITLDQSNPPFYRWFKDGLLNMSYNCIDRHLIDIPYQNALIWESAMLNQSRVYTYLDLHEHVSKLAGVMRTLGVKFNDRVIIYMPMIPEAVFAMLATSRLGAIHSVVFGGFSAKELASRIADCQPSLIICGSCGLEPNKVIDYKELLDEALHMNNNQQILTLVVQRDVKPTNQLVNGRDFDYHTAMRFASPVEPQPVRGEHPLYILYTSGTTGQPKGIVRDTGGTAVALTWTMNHIMGIKKGDVYFSGSDIGWVVGHSFIVYGPLLTGATTILFEGKPTIPNAGEYWRIVEKYRVNGMYSSPTALRSLRREDPNGDWIKKFDISSLHSLSMAGERCDVPTYQWIESSLGVLINDNYWQTETGWIISCNYKNLHTFAPKPGSATKPAPGFIVYIMDHDNKPIEQPDKMGRICIKLPLPPSFMLTLYGNDQAFVQKYLSDTPGYYTSGDAGYYDHDGYLNIMSRVDDIINTAGHRLSTAAMEEVLMHHADVVEAAVVARKDDLRGEIPIGLVVLQKNRVIKKQQLEKELVALVRHEIGPVAAFRNVVIVDKLPKTRSGKVLRGVIKKIIDGESFKMPATIEDETVLITIKQSILDYGQGLGQVSGLVYRDNIDKPTFDAEDLQESD